MKLKGIKYAKLRHLHKKSLLNTLHRKQNLNLCKLLYSNDNFNLNILLVRGLYYPLDDLVRKSL